MKTWQKLLLALVASAGFSILAGVVWIHLAASHLPV